MPQLSMHTPVGEVTLTEEDGAIVAVDWGRGRDQQVTPLLARAREQMNEYFDGARTEFDLPLASEGSEFQKKVWAELRRIPYGDTATYGDIAHRLGYEPVIARAVGTANASNPLPIVVPCHRVIGSDGKLTGYAGGIDRKRTLLELEQPGLF